MIKIVHKKEWVKFTSKKFDRVASIKTLLAVTTTQKVMLETYKVPHHEEVQHKVAPSKELQSKELDH